MSKKVIEGRSPTSASSNHHLLALPFRMQQTAGMSVAMVATALALLAGLGCGGRLAALERVPLRGWPLLAGAAVAQLLGVVLGVLGAPPGPAYAAGLGASAALVAAFLAANRDLAGTGLIALGLGLNAVVIAANGAMPVSAPAAVRAGVGADAVADRRHEPATNHTRLALLGDIVPAPLPVRPEVISPGDVGVAAGLAQLAFTATGPRRRRPGRRQRRRTSLRLALTPLRRR